MEEEEEEEEPCLCLWYFIFRPSSLSISLCGFYCSVMIDLFVMRFF